MSIDFTKQNNLQEKLILVKVLYERFNLSSGNLIDMNLVDKVISKAIEVKRDTWNKYENLPKEIRSAFVHGAKGISLDDQIYLLNDVSVDTIFHEILHSVTFEHKGVSKPLIDSCTEEEIGKLIDKYGEGRALRQIEQLDESMTRFITELAVPEAEINDSYAYGAGIIKKYYEGLLSNNIDPSFILNMYINGDESDFMKFKNSFGDNFFKVLDMIERVNCVRFYVLKPPAEPEISKDEMDKIISDAIMQVEYRI